MREKERVVRTVVFVAPEYKTVHCAHFSEIVLPVSFVQPERRLTLVAPSHLLHVQRRPVVPANTTTLYAHRTQVVFNLQTRGTVWAGSAQSKLSPSRNIINQIWTKWERTRQLCSHRYRQATRVRSACRRKVWLASCRSGSMGPQATAERKGTRASRAPREGFPAQANKFLIKWRDCHCTRTL